MATSKPVPVAAVPWLATTTVIRIGCSGAIKKADKPETIRSGNRTGVGVGVRVGVAVAVPVGLGVGVEVAAGVLVLVAGGVTVLVGVRVGVAVLVDVDVGVGVGVGARRTVMVTVATFERWVGLAAWKVKVSVPLKAGWAE